jgi:putative protein kinase ArgK-like GTPase of G3E family
VGETGKGIALLVDEIKAHEAALVATGFLRTRRQENLAWELGRGAAERVIKRLERDGRKGFIEELTHSVLDKRIDFYDALDALEGELTRA